jgi:hypothetical protein
VSSSAAGGVPSSSWADTTGENEKLVSIRRSKRRNRAGILHAKRTWDIESSPLRVGGVIR